MKTIIRNAIDRGESIELINMMIELYVKKRKKEQEKKKRKKAIQRNNRFWLIEIRSDWM